MLIDSMFTCLQNMRAGNVLLWVLRLFVVCTNCPVEFDPFYIRVAPIFSCHIFGQQVDQSRHWINMQAVRFYVKNNIMKEIVWPIERDLMIQLLYVAVLGYIYILCWETKNC